MVIRFILLCYVILQTILWYICCYGDSNKGAVLVLQLRADSPHVELLRHRVTSELRKERRALLLLHGSRQLMMPGSPSIHKGL